MSHDVEVIEIAAGSGVEVQEVAPAAVDLSEQTSGFAVVLTDAPTIATDARLGGLFTVTLGGNRTLGNPTGLVDGRRVLWRLVQDAVGGRTLTLGPMFHVDPDVAGPITVAPEPGAVTYLGAIYRTDPDTGPTLDVLSFGPGF